MESDDGAAAAHADLGVGDRGVVDGDLQEREQWVRDMRAKKHVTGTTSAYAGWVTRFVTYLLVHAPAALAEWFRQRAAELPDKRAGSKGELTRRQYVADCISKVDTRRLGSTGLLNFAHVTADTVLHWMAEFKGRDGSTAHKSAFGGSQSALVDLWKRHGQVP